MPQRLIDLTGQRFGRLTVLRRHPFPSASRWVVRCDCGTEKVTDGHQMRTGAVVSCGCFHRERTSEVKSTHRQSKTNLYAIWKGILSRCLNPRRSHYPYYGGRGITVCDRWRQSFQDFASDMGPRPSPRHSIDRIDPNGPYAPDNCRWATAFEQRHNRADARKVS